MEVLSKKEEQILSGGDNMIDWDAVQKLKFYNNNLGAGVADPLPNWCRGVMDPYWVLFLPERLRPKGWDTALLEFCIAQSLSASRGDLHLDPLIRGSFARITGFSPAFVDGYYARFLQRQRISNRSC